MNATASRIAGIVTLAYPVEDTETGEIYTVEAVSAESAVLEAAYTLGSELDQEDYVSATFFGVCLGKFLAYYEDGVR